MVYISVQQITAVTSIAGIPFTTSDESKETAGAIFMQVVVVGSSERLGNWQADNGLAMQWNEGDDWTVDLDLPVE